MADADISCLVAALLAMAEETGSFCLDLETKLSLSSLAVINLFDCESVSHSV